MKQAIWTERYEVGSFLVDFNKKMSLHGLMSLLQETAWCHADHLGHGYAQTDKRGAAWVLIRQRVEMEIWPGWGDTLSVRTWLRPPGPVVVTRDFELLVGDRLMGRAAAHWITIDQGSRRPIPLQFPDEPGQFRAGGHLEIEPSRLPTLADDLEVLAEFEVRPSDLDMNRHVNNTRFAQWVLDALPWQVHESYTLRSYQINFLAEARLGDRVVIRCPKGAAVGAGTAFQGWRANDDRVLFAARLEAAPAGGEDGPGFAAAQENFA